MNELLGVVCGVVILLLLRSWTSSVLTELKLINSNLLALRGKVSLIASEAGRREELPTYAVSVTPPDQP